MNFLIANPMTEQEFALTVKTVELLLGIIGILIATLTAMVYAEIRGLRKKIHDNTNQLGWCLGKLGTKPPRLNTDENGE